MSVSNPRPILEREERYERLRRQLRDPQAIMGCGDAPDIGAAVAECERIEREMAVLEATREAAREAGGEARC